jgi:hypothetical protein
MDTGQNSILHVNNLSLITNSMNDPGASPEVSKGVCESNILVSDARVGVLNHFP